VGHELSNDIEPAPGGMEASREEVNMEEVDHLRRRLANFGTMKMDEV
jgi:hypothetical protein